jgi:excisionase family DNA binding protein
VSGRITTYLDLGLVWTKPRFVACCRDCGTELARHTKQHVAERAARRRRCPTCGTRGAWRLPGTTSLATDLELAKGRRWAPAGRRRWPHDRPPVPAPTSPEGGEFCMSVSRTWLRAAEAAALLHVSPKTVSRWAKDGRLPYRRTLGGHRRYDPQQLEALVRALTYRP